MKKRLAIVKGAGDLATGVGYKLVEAGYQVVMTEISEPTVVRRRVAFAEAVYEGHVTVQGVTAKLANNLAQVIRLLEEKKVIPVIIDPEATVIKDLSPMVVVDAIIAKKNIGTRIDDASLVIGIGPGFTAGVDVGVVIESNRGPDLAKIIYQGAAEPNTDIPGAVDGYTLERVLRAPAGGIFTGIRDIGDHVTAGETIGYIDGQISVEAQIAGVIRGLLRSGLRVKMGLKIGDIDPRGIVDLCYQISDKALAIGSAIVKACNDQLGELP
ncbi:MAG: EF2563 family selenium-dependent molybdenum hydroxylase system protein [Clostridia bacterium]|nr:EF2563 family selenium-dependent molybdenum hydroxylase system protein [Clostridia bacterium]